MVDIIKKKKKWYKILASNEFNNVEIGETLTFDAKNLVGKNVVVNLATLINDIKKQNAKIVFKIVKADDNLNTKFVSYGLLPSYIRGIVRRDKQKIEDSFNCITKDNINMVIKTLMITRNKTKHTVLSKIRKYAKEILTQEIKNENVSDLLRNIAMNKLQRGLRENVNKVYPLSMCEIKFFGMI